MRPLHVLAMVLIPALLPLGPLHAQTSGAAEESTAVEGQADPAARKPSLSIDSLLRPRAGSARPAPPRPPTEELHGGRNREGWAKAFEDARAEVKDGEERVEKTRKKIGEKSQGGYTYSPLGGTDTSTTDPEVIKLRAQLTRDRKDLEAARSRLRDLQVEASLSGVPQEWIPREEKASSPSETATPPAESARPN
jgi:hypothetical protein